MRKNFSLDRFLWILNILAISMLLLSWLAFYSPLEKLVVISFFSLLVPGLLFINTLFFLYWLIKKKRKAFIVSIILLLSFICFGRFYGTSLSDLSDKSTFSIMSYNVRGLNLNQQLPIKHVDSAIFRFVKDENPDVFCVQESHKIMKRKGFLDEVYPYKFVDYVSGIPSRGVINSVYSKYPILNYEVIDFPESHNTAIYTDIQVNLDTIRIYNVHLQSFRLPPEVAYLQNEESGKVYNRITRTIQLQEQQAVIILEDMKSCKYPILVVGDFNNVQFSKVYRGLKGDLKDSFLEAGSGFGGTYELFNIPLRIDYILGDESFKFTSHTNYDIQLSDHYPIMAEMVLSSDK